MVEARHSPTESIELKVSTPKYYKKNDVPKAPASEGDSHYKLDAKVMNIIESGGLSDRYHNQY